MIMHAEISIEELRKKIRQNEIRFGGNEKLKIYGTLQCKSGKRMKKENRLFFRSENEAIKNGFRPCGHCMKNKYEAWKKSK
ncbi:MAG: Ada metal-binding domain-containing protein [Ginsengibacter sp.]